MNPLTYFNLVLRQLPNEKLEQAVSSTLQLVSGLIGAYLPLDKVDWAKGLLFDCLLMMLSQGPEENLRKQIVNNVVNFMAT